MHKEDVAQLNTARDTKVSTPLGDVLIELRLKSVDLENIMFEIKELSARIHRYEAVPEMTSESAVCSEDAGEATAVDSLNVIDRQLGAALVIARRVKYHMSNLI